MTFGVSWPSVAFPRPKAPTSLGNFTKLNILESKTINDYYLTINDARASAQAVFFESQVMNPALWNSQSLTDLTVGYCMSLWRADYINDWRELKLEREI